MDELQKKIINKTDLHFFRYCEDNFGINRGVYNTIDQWFYKRISIVLQREDYILLNFLNVHLDLIRVPINLEKEEAK